MKNWIILCLSVTNIVFAIAWYFDRKELSFLTELEDQEYYETRGNCDYYRWKENGKPSYSACDENMDGKYERSMYFTYWGDQQSSLYYPTNPYINYVIKEYGPTGKIVRTWHDTNGDGFGDSVIIVSEDAYAVFVDRDHDGQFLSSEKVTMSDSSMMEIQF